MNLRPPPPPELRPHGAVACLRHPGQNSTGLCAPCLRERLSLLNPSACPPTSNSTHTSKSSVPLFDGRNAASFFSSSSIFSKLRRCNTFSGNKCESVVGLPYEPRRNSCDVRVRPSLWALFNMEDEGRSEVTRDNNGVVECKESGPLGGTCPVLELTEHEAETHVEGGIGVSGGGIGRFSDEIRAPLEEEQDVIVRDAGRFEERMGNQNHKTIKEFIDLESKRSTSKSARRDFKEIAGSFWIAASVFSKKLRKWNRKQVSGGRPGGAGGYGGGVGDSVGMGLRAGARLRETQSEAGGEYWFGRRSTDTDPRYSIDLARASFDCGRISFDLLGRRSCDSDPRFSIDLGRTSVDGGSRTSFRESARFAIDPGRASFDGGGATSFKEPPRSSFDRGRSSFRETTAATSSTTAARFSVDPGRASFDGGRGSFKEAALGYSGYSIDGGRRSFREAGGAGCSLDRGKGSFRDLGRCYMDREEVMLERNWSTRYSRKNQLDAGLLRFSLPPLKAYKRSSSAEKSRFNRSSSVARTMLKLY